MHSSCLYHQEVTLLRERTTRFLSDHSVWKTALRQVLRRIVAHDWEAVIFGGVLRDLMVLGGKQAPRDVDIVVAIENYADLEREFADLIHARTRFGGFRLRPKGWLIDIWTLDNTWAFRQGLVTNSSFDRLVKTTFLNVEAVAAEIVPKAGHSRRIYSAGFFEAIEGKVLDISFEPNPYPALCVVRSIVTALRLGFALSNKLATYIVHYARTLPVHALAEAQLSHYGNVRVREATILEYIRSLEEQLEARSPSVIFLPESRREQLLLSEYWTPVC